MIDEEAIVSGLPSERFLVIPGVGVVSAKEDSLHHHHHNDRNHRDDGVNSVAPSGFSTTSASRKKKKKKKKSLYDLYHKDDSEDNSSGVDDWMDLDEAATMSAYGAASASGRSGAGEHTPSATPSASPNVYDITPFTVGMDINLLLNQVHQNILRSVCLDDYEGTGRFVDSDLVCLAAALRHNASLVSLQLRYLPVTDVSLVPLCKALEAHPTLRALDLSGTKGTRKTGEALRRLACVNTHLLHIMVEETMYQEKDMTILEEALQYNAMMCADPRSNPYDVRMISKISELERARKQLDEQLSYNPWLQGPPPSSSLLATSSEAPKKQNPSKKSVGFREDREEQDGVLQQRVCAEYISGCCRYGSRCKYYHPPWTAALGQVALLQKYNAEEERKRQWSRMSSVGGADYVSSAGAQSVAESCDTRSHRWEDCSFGDMGRVGTASQGVATSTTTAGGTKLLRRRGRETEFTLDARKVGVRQQKQAPELRSLLEEECSDDDDGADEDAQHRRGILLALVCLCCCALTLTAAVARRRRGLSHQ